MGWPRAPKKWEGPCLENYKICTRCGEMKPFESFSRHKAHSSGRHPQCKDCYRAWRLNADYGITAEDVELMRKQQQNKCPGCMNELIRAKIDHCHETGRVRMLFCNLCNVAEGMIKHIPHIHDLFWITVESNLQDLRR